MDSTFICYIDEAGDDGLQFNKGSSTWFIETGIITVRQEESLLRNFIAKVKTEFGMSEKDHMRWKKLNHSKKMHLSAEIAQRPICVISICIDKSKIKEPDVFRQKDRLYFYYARYLLERISWYARDSFTSKIGGNGKIDLIFSYRARMCYKDLWDYFNYLKYKSTPDINISWSSIGNYYTESPGKIRGLQIADACAGAFFNGLELDKFGRTESFYALTLKPVIYNRNKNYFSYGFKIIGELEEYKNNKSLQWISQFK